jgi:hypothetical protein
MAVILNVGLQSEMKNLTKCKLADCQSEPVLALSIKPLCLNIWVTLGGQILHYGLKPAVQNDKLGLSGFSLNLLRI